MAYRAGNKCQRQNHYAGYHTKLYHPDVFYRVAQGADEGGGNYNVAESQPVGAVGQPGVAGIGIVHGVINGCYPARHKIREDGRMVNHKSQLGFYREGGNPAQHQANDKYPNPNADAFS